MFPLGTSTVYVAGSGGVNYRPNPNPSPEPSPDPSPVLLRDNGFSTSLHSATSHASSGEQGLASGHGLNGVSQPTMSIYGNVMDIGEVGDIGQGLAQGQGLALAQGPGLTMMVDQPVRHWLFVEHHVGDLQGIHQPYSHSLIPLLYATSRAVDSYPPPIYTIL